MTISRRRFLQLGTLASASIFVPKFLNSFIAHQPRVSRKLIIIQLSGGNDGLNTVVPYRNDIYYRSRPTIGIPGEKTLQITCDAGLHPSLSGIRSLYDSGEVAILNSVGYPNPCRSHFRSLDIWHSGVTNQSNTGWLGRYQDYISKANAIVEMDETCSLALKGRISNGIALGTRLNRTNSDKLLLTHRLSSTQELMNGQDELQDRKRLDQSSNYPDTAFGERLKQVGSLITGGGSTQVYYASLGSFDTHVDQTVHHNRLLKELDGSMSALVADLKKSGYFKDTLIMAFSEFGRRVAENETKGTDHGAANNVFLVSGGLKKAGLYNAMPDLTDLDDGDVKHQIDFREIYATILGHWLEVDYQEILGSHYSKLAFV